MLHTAKKVEHKMKRKNLVAYLLTAEKISSNQISSPFEISFENVHKQCKKSTPTQIVMYQISLKLHKLLNSDESNLSFEHLTVLDQMVCTGRQLNFQINRTNCTKIGMNTTANKLYHLSNLIRLDQLNLSFVHFKRLAKFQFLKFDPN